MGSPDAFSARHCRCQGNLWSRELMQMPSLRLQGVSFRPCLLSAAGEGQRFSSSEKLRYQKCKLR